MTVREALFFSAHLKLPREMSKAEKVRPKGWVVAAHSLSHVPGLWCHQMRHAP